MSKFGDFGHICFCNIFPFLKICKLRPITYKEHHFYDGVFKIGFNVIFFLQKTLMTAILCIYEFSKHWQYRRTNASLCLIFTKKKVSKLNLVFIFYFVHSFQIRSLNKENCIFILYRYL